MNRLLLTILFTLSALATENARASTVTPAMSTEAILKIILAYKKMEFRPDIPIPAVALASQTPLKEFQDDVEPQWHIRPDVITNVFIVQKNKIYLFDDADYYKKTKRCIEDSLAHELAHYVQSKYKGWEMDEGMEWDAIETQNWFRERYCPKAN